jgi:hypothetical protein
MGRGIGAAFVRDLNPVTDSWKLTSFTKLSSFNEFTDINKVENILKKHPNFWMTVRFPRPPDWLYQKYLRVREHNVYDEENVLANVSKEDMCRALLVIALRDIMLTDSSLSINRIILHLKNEHDVSITKAMIESCIEDAKQLVIKIKEKALDL